MEHTIVNQSPNAPTRPSVPRQWVDHSAIRTNQALVITLLALGLVLDAPALVVMVAAALALSALAPRFGPFTALYRYVLRPAGIVKPDVRADHAAPHRFAQSLGGTFLIAASLALLAGMPILGWGLAVLVMALASLNLFAGWCAGCMMYYWLNRLGVPGFDRSPLETS